MQKFKLKTVEPTTQICDMTSNGINACQERRYRRWLAGISSLTRAGSFSRHSYLNGVIKQNLSPTHIPFVSEPRRHLYRTDQKRPDGLTLVPWAVGKYFLWDVTVVDYLAPSRKNAGI